MAKLIYVIMLGLTVAACQSGERRLDISGDGVRQPCFRADPRGFPAFDDEPLRHDKADD